MEGERVAVTGGAGFLGSHFVRLVLAMKAEQVLNIDALTYAGDIRRLEGLDSLRHRFLKADICDGASIRSAFSEFMPDYVVHFAADSHVTRSEQDPERFYRTNVEGTRCLLQASEAAGIEKFLHISTDEVYGSIGRGEFKEGDKREGESQASSAYAKSKSIADDLALSFAARIPVTVVRPTNAFGPWQFPEKALPRWVARALSGRQIPVWGDGRYIRQWLFAEDFASAIALLIAEGRAGEAYNVSPQHQPEITNLALVEWLVDYLDLPAERLEFTDYDRPQHDRRYAIDSTKIRQLGWKPGDVWEQFGSTVEWYKKNEAWWRDHLPEAESIYTDLPL